MAAYRLQRQQDRGILQECVSHVIKIIAPQITLLTGFSLTRRTGGDCTYPNTSDAPGADLKCRFIADMTATTGPSSSLMFMPFLPTV